MKKLDFNEVYERIYTEYGDRLNNLKRGVIVKCVLCVVVFLVLEILTIRFLTHLPMLISLLLFGLIAIEVLLIKKLRKKYIQEYKVTAINNLVKAVNDTYKYSPSRGLTSAEYKQSSFDKSYDIFRSEDEISGFVSENIPMKMSQVTTQEERTTTDSDGHTTTTYVTTFLGLYGIITLPCSVSELRIKNDSKFLKFKENRVEMESAEFEKYFDVFAENRQNAMEVLTPDTIEEMVKLKNRYKKCKIFNITLRGKYLYFRIGVGDIFEPPTFKSAVDYSMLLKYFEIIDLPREIYESLEENIKIMAGLPTAGNSQYSNERISPENYFQKNT